MFIEPRTPSKPLSPFMGGITLKSFRADHEVSTTCVSRWDQASILVEFMTHPLTRVVLTSSRVSSIKTQRRIALLNDAITFQLTSFLSQLFLLVMFDNYHAARH